MISQGPTGIRQTPDAELDNLRRASSEKSAVTFDQKSERGETMKRILAVATFAVLGIVLLNPLFQRGTSSWEAQAQKSVPTPCVQPSGKFAFSADGHVLEGNPSHRGYVAWAGYISFFSGGRLNGTDTVNYADQSPVVRVFSGTYTMAANCSVNVALSFSSGDPGGTANLAFYFADRGKQFRFVQTDLFRVASGSGIRVN